MASKYPEHTITDNAPVMVTDVPRESRITAKINVEYVMHESDESLSRLQATGQCRMKYVVTGTSRHPDEMALQLEDLAKRVKK